MRPEPFLLERYFARYEFSAPYLLCSSDCESLHLQDLLALQPGAETRLRDLWLGYTESSGAPALRQQIAAIYDTITAEDVLVHSGAEEAIYLFMHATLQAGDAVVVHWPCYQSLHAVARSLGCEVRLWQACQENDWRLDLDELKDLLRPGTRALVVNMPHNPTGALMDAERWREVAALCRERGVLFFADEVYRELEYDAHERLPAGCDLDPSVISLGVMSKTYGLAGLRIGWIATHNRAVRERMAQMKDYTTICNSAPSELLAEVALRHRQRLAGRNLSIIAANLDLLDAFFAAHGRWFEWVRPRAGPIAFPRLLIGEVDAFCERLVQEKGVLLLPGTLFGDDGNHFRIGFGRSNMAEALTRLEAFVREQGA